MSSSLQWTAKIIISKHSPASVEGKREAGNIEHGGPSYWVTGEERGQRLKELRQNIFWGNSGSSGSELWSSPVSWSPELATAAAAELEMGFRDWLQTGPRTPPPGGCPWAHQCEPPFSKSNTVCCLSTHVCRPGSHLNPLIPTTHYCPWTTASHQSYRTFQVPYEFIYYLTSSPEWKRVETLTNQPTLCSFHFLHSHSSALISHLLPTTCNTSHFPTSGSLLKTSLLTRVPGIWPAVKWWPRSGQSGRLRTFTQRVPDG